MGPTALGWQRTCPGRRTVCLCPCSLRTSAWSPTPSPSAALNCAWVPPELRHTDCGNRTPRRSPKAGLGTGLPGFLVPSGTQVMPVEPCSRTFPHSQVQQGIPSVPFLPGTRCNWAQLAALPGPALSILLWIDTHGRVWTGEQGQRAVLAEETQSRAFKGEASRGAGVLTCGAGVAGTCLHQCVQMQGPARPGARMKRTGEGAVPGPEPGRTEPEWKARPLPP